MTLSNNSIKKTLLNIDNPFSVDEAHGFVCGYLCLLNKFDTHDNSINTFFFGGKGVTSISPSDIKILKSFAESINSGLQSHTIELPYESELDLHLKILRMGKWATTFSISINTIVKLNNVDDSELSEIITDIDEISRIDDKYELNNSKEDIQYYNEINKYIKNIIHHLHVRQII